MMHCFEGTEYQLQLEIRENSVHIAGGHFGEIELLPSVLFEMRVKNLADGQSITLSSESRWESVQVGKKEDALDEYSLEILAGRVYRSWEDFPVNGLPESTAFIFEF